MNTISHAPSDLSDAITRTKSFLKNDKLQRLVIDRGASDATTIQRAKSLGSLELSLQHGAVVNSISTEAIKALGTRSEEYTLTIPGDGSKATLTANSTLGLLRGLTTFEQLWYFTNGEIYTLEAPFAIADSPAFPYRGFMLDTSRNFFPVSDIKRTLDAMSWTKLNQLHWHAVDSQSFPLQIPGFEEIAAKGAYSSSMVYSPADIQDIVSYAAARGIDVLGEIDTPGHTAIISESHPEHIACPQATPWSDFANEPPAGQLRLASPATSNFTASLLTAAAKMFPSSLFSTGGDELNTNCYAQDAETQASLQASGQTLAQAIDTFVLANHKALHAIGKQGVVWEEMVLDQQVPLSTDTVVMVWTSSSNAGAVAAKGYNLVHAPSDFFYLDCGLGEWLGSDIDGVSWCAPLKTWQKAYSFDPLANISASQAHLVLGGQQLLWTEQSAPSNLDSMAWPRAASSAEVFWTGPTLSDGADRTSDASLSAALPRLHDLRYRMVQRGVKAINLQPEWCALRPGVCDLTA